MTIHAFGDSVTYGNAASPLSNGYVPLLSTAMGISINNHGIAGDMVPDAMPKVYGVTPAAGDKFTMMFGINDERIYGVDSTRQSYFRRGEQCIAAYLATGTKEFARTSGTFAGTWGNTPVNGIGKSSNTNGSTASFTVTGTTVYIGMLQQDGAPGTFNVLIDGIPFETGATTQTVGLSTTYSGHPGVTYGAMLKRYPGLSSGSHTVEIVVTSATGGANFVYIDWVAGNGGQAFLPGVYVGNVLRAVAYTAGGSDANVAAYNVEVAGLVSELAADGLNVFLINVSSALNQTTDMDPDYHPINAGHAKLESAFNAVMNPPPAYSAAVIEMDGSGNFYGRSAGDTTGATRRLL